MTAIRDHQVVVVAGETGSGKTTQLPKICLELGRGVLGTIGHTQPRRIAARTVAERLADELGVKLGHEVGYAVRFDDRVADETLVKVMTDGILLAEIRRDRSLSAYDTIIVDEAHERSLNIDFLLGYLARLLPDRPDLKVVITSATIDTERFAAHFGAPVVEVSGRTWPVEVRYRPLEEPEAPSDDEGAGAIDLNQGICRAVTELTAVGPGDILVFLPGERDIRDAADALRQAAVDDVEILPLYARLTAAEQHRIFRPHPGRRVVLATNVAETSLTVPGIRYVIDSGLARISRFNHRTKVQRLPIEAVSQASANQRAGRCGRLGPGVCIRLYAESDFLARPDYTDPEILRTNLASVMLQMAAIGLGPVEDFPFLEPPDRRAITDGRALLEELGALSRDDGGRLTRVGRRLADLPIDPRLGRMVVEGERLGCLREVVVIVAALSIQDPRERPTEQPAAAAEMHARFEVASSDFMGVISLWEYLSRLQEELSGNQFRRRCRQEFLHVLRIREWQDLAGQIRQVLRAGRARFNREPANADQIHQALLAGLLSHIGMRDQARGDYTGARNSRWAIGRASVLARRPPAWAMAGELVETERTWARTVARIEPAWAARAGDHLLKRSWSEPWWDPHRAEAVTEERASLYGLPVVSPRVVGLRRIDAAEARRWFIDEALVARDWTVDFPPHRLTARREEMVEDLEERVRRSGLLSGPETRRAWYESEVPPGISSGAALLKWWRTRAAGDPERLALPLSILVDRRGGPVDLSDYPDEWSVGGIDLPISYRYEPGADDDGVTVQVPLDVLNRVDAGAFDWQIPGYRPELIAGLIRSLPKALRRSLGPAPEAAAAVLAEVTPTQGDLLTVVANQLSRLVGEPVRPDIWTGVDLPEHLRVRFALTDRGTILASGRDLARLRRDHRPQMLAALARAFPGWEHGGADTWEWGDIPVVVESGPRRAWPGLVERPHDGAGRRVGLTVWDTPNARAAAMWPATRTLLRLAAPVPDAHIRRRLSQASQLAVAQAGRSLGDLIADCTDAVVDQMIVAAGGPPLRRAAFEAMAAEARESLGERVIRLTTIAGGVLAAAVSVLDGAERIEARYPGGRYDRALTDIRTQIAQLTGPGFVSAAGPGRMRDLLRYLDGAGRRLERLPTDTRRDGDRQALVARLQNRLDRLADRLAAGSAETAAAVTAASVRWMIEELRVSLWAQQLGTSGPVSEERISRALDEVGA